ncbi:2-dehydropantoate 2-reductase [Sulfurimonas sp.]|uniref:2-dehydropantoate 2-reductase n=1 Tax=Sulfurimonas sp. TaxID=2022749 RepID=UPI002B4A234D|nr:2-dehydropantoate 2-reductase [Sulfurimonas sp.]
MKFLILGAGGIGSYFGARLLKANHEVTFVARGEHLLALQKNGLHLEHPKFNFDDSIRVYTIEEVKTLNPCEFDIVIITTKANSNQNLANQLNDWFADYERIPYILSLQNGVENEETFSKYINPKYIIGGLTRKIGAHIISPSNIKAVGIAETIIGAISKTKDNRIFLEELQINFNNAQIPTQISKNIDLDLWKKLIINNGVNAICALLKVKTGIIMSDEKLKKIVYELMSETAIAAKNKNITITKKDVNEMYELITKFDSIKPSMLVDREFSRALELEDICGVVIRNSEEQNIDAPYTRTISTLLDYTYKKNKLKKEKKIDLVVTVVVSRRIKKNKEEQFEQFSNELTKVATSFKGYVGAIMIRPVSLDDPEYRLVYKFDNQENLDKWIKSTKRAVILNKIEPLLEKPSETIKSLGLATWLSFPRQAEAKAPKKYKITIVSWLALYPLITLIFLIFGDILAEIPLLLRTFIVTAVAMVLMSYVLMPRFTKLFYFWLFPKEEEKLR